MNTDPFNPDASLADIELLPAVLVDRLREYNILSVGHLLSATKGLTTNLDIFSDPGDDQILSSLIRIIPSEILKEYQFFEFRAPTGLIGPKNETENESEKNIPGQ